MVSFLFVFWRAWPVICTLLLSWIFFFIFYCGISYWSFWPSLFSLIWMAWLFGWAGTWPSIWNARNSGTFTSSSLTFILLTRVVCSVSYTDLPKFTFICLCFSPPRLREVIFISLTLLRISFSWVCCRMLLIFSNCFIFFLVFIKVFYLLDVVFLDYINIIIIRFKVSFCRHFGTVISSSCWFTSLFAARTPIFCDFSAKRTFSCAVKLLRSLYAPCWMNCCWKIHIRRVKFFLKCFKEILKLIVNLWFANQSSLFPLLCLK